MAEATNTNVNYTDEMVQAMVADYTAAPTRVTVEKLADEFGKSARSIIAKLSREGVYQPQARTTKSGEPIVRKEEIVAEIEATVGGKFPSLVKATKSDLQALLEEILSS